MDNQRSDPGSPDAASETRAAHGGGSQAAWPSAPSGGPRDGLAQLDDLPAVNALRRRALLIASGGEFVDGYDLVIIAGALLFLKPQFGLSPAQVGFVAASAYIGAFLGQIVFGNLSDELGRRAIYLFNLLAFVVLAIASAFVANIYELLVIRFLIGVAVGADIPTSMAYLNELAPRRSRGSWAGSLPNLSWAIGALVAAFIWLPLLSVGPNAWRIAFALAAVPAFLVWLGRQTLPESPRWLLRNGETQQARDVLAAFGAENATLTDAGTGERSWTELFQGEQGVRTGATTLLFILNGVAAPIATIATPFILRYVGLLSTQQSLLFSGLVWLANLLGVVTSWYLIDRVGRRRLVITTQVLAGVCAVGIALFGVGRPPVMVPLFFLFGYLQWAAGIPTMWLWASELFPTRLRGAGQGVGNGINRLAIAGNGYLVPVVIAAFGFTPLILGFSVLVFAFAVVVAVFPFFATEGRSLEEINEDAVYAVAEPTLGEGRT